jgi:hypothetical protein
MKAKKKIWIFILLGIISVTLILTLALGIVAVGAWAIFNNLPQAPTFTGDVAYQIWCEGDTVRTSRGEHITLTVTLKNNTGKTYSYEGSYSELKPEVVLVSEDGKFKIEHSDMPFTNDFAKHTFNHGDTRTTLFYFTIPENAPKGNYTAEMSFMGSRSEQAEVVKVN